MNICCELWQNVVKDFQNQLLADLEKANVPSFVLKPQERAIKAWPSFCPSCSSQLIPDATPAVPKPTPVVKKKLVEFKKVPCANCKGQGKIAGGGLDGVNCMKCWGRGYITKENNVRDGEDVNIAQLEEKVKEKEEEIEKKRIDQSLEKDKND